MKFLVGFALAVVVVCVAGNPLVSGWCSPEKRCTLNSDCASGVCCNNVCQRQASLSDIGEACGSTCFGTCEGGPEIACTSGRCERTMGTLAIGCECQQDAWCKSGVCNSTAIGSAALECLPGNVAVGQACVHHEQCVTFGVVDNACQNGVCASLPAVDPDTGFASICVPGSQSCPADMVCANFANTGTFNCTTPRAAGEACTHTRECGLSMACNSTVCIEAGSGAPGTPCSADYMCDSWYCSARGVCSLPLHSVPDGGECLDGDAVCRVGSRCSGTRAPICERVVGKPCMINGGGGPTTECNNDQSNSQCGCDGAYGTCKAKVQDFGKLGVCTAESWQVARYFGVSLTGAYQVNAFNALAVSDVSVLPANIVDAAARFMCCLACVADDPFDAPSLGIFGPVQGYFSFKLEGCGTVTPRLVAADNRENGRCTLHKRVAERDLGSCPRATGESEKSTLEKNKTAFLIGGIVGGVVLVGLIAAVVVVVMKGGSGGGGKSSARPTEDKTVTA